MKFWKRTALCLALCAALLAGCAPARDAAESDTPADPLTGQELLWPGQRPVAVTIENDPSSTTQWGLSTASVVLQALTETQTPTSLCLVYPAVDAVPQVGPVSAGQDLYWRLLVGQQVLPVQRGGGAFDQNYLDYYSLRAVDALETGTNAFSCDSAWSNSPLWYTSGSALAGVLDKLNISSVLTESRLTDAAASGSSESETETTVLSVPALLPQQTKGHLPDAAASDAVSVRVQFDASNATGFSYDADSSTYKMLHADGTPQLDANNGQQAGFDNLLVLFSASALRDDGLTLDYDLTMGGGVWLNGGHLWPITWTQGSDTTFFLLRRRRPAADPDRGQQLHCPRFQPHRTGTHGAELRRGEPDPCARHRGGLRFHHPLTTKNTLAGCVCSSRGCFFVFCYKSTTLPTSAGGGGDGAQLDFVYVPAYHEVHGLAGSKIGLVGQFQRGPVLRRLAEAVEHGPAARGQIQRKGRGVCCIFAVERGGEAAAADGLAVADRRQPRAQPVQLVGGGHIAALQIARADGQRLGREVFHRQVHKGAAQLRRRGITQQLDGSLAVQQSRFTLITGGQCRSRNAGEQGSSQADRTGTGTFQERAAGQGLGHRGFLLTE